jgi:hypothetical protein
MEKFDSEIIQASATRYLIDGGEEDAANVLLSCEFSIYESGDTWYAGDEQIYAMHVTLTEPRTAYTIINDGNHPIRDAIEKAIIAVMPNGFYLRHLTAHVELVEIDQNWRNELLEIARGRGVHNQVVAASNFRVWQNLRFRSESEVRVARALDKLGVLFLPNCKARLGIESNRQNREADFLICFDGKWGILEVDGEPFHPPSRTSQDHERDRLFRSHGIIVVEHFDASQCYQDPDSVVQAFLEILKKS